MSHFWFVAPLSHDDRIDRKQLLHNFRAGAEAVLSQAELMPYAGPITEPDLIAIERQLHAMQQLLVSLRAHAVTASSPCPA